MGIQALRPQFEVICDVWACREKIITEASDAPQAGWLFIDMYQASKIGATTKSKKILCPRCSDRLNEVIHAANLSFIR